MKALTLRARVLVFIASLLVLAAVPVPGWTRLPIGCAVYLLVVLPALTPMNDSRIPNPRIHGRRLGGGPVVTRVPVQRIGRDAKRVYCPRCGQKRRVCRCPPVRGELP